MKKLLFLAILLLTPFPSLYADSLNTNSILVEKNLTQLLSVDDNGSSSLDLNSVFTIETWVKPTSQPNPEVNRSNIILSKHKNFTQEGYELIYRNDLGVTQLRLRVSEALDGSDTDVVFVPLTLENDRWYHLAVTGNVETMVYKFFVNGVQIGGDQYGAQVESYANNTASFVIGANDDNSGPRYPFDGKIDEVRIWNIIRTEQQILDNFSSQLSGDEGGLVGYWKLNGDLFDGSQNNNNLTNVNNATFNPDVPFGGNVIPEFSLTEKIQNLIDSVLGYGFDGKIENSYLAHLKKLEGFVENGQFEAAENQLEVFIKKVEKDLAEGLISADIHDDLLIQAEDILSDIEELATREVPLITQTISEHPSIAETTAWAGATYAGGNANYAGGCGSTIEQCGCVISSMSMLGQYHGIDTGVDGTEVNPLNMNAWLTANNGYTAKGSIYWAKALQYLGEDVGGVIKTKLSHDAFNATSTGKVNQSLKKSGPAVAFSTVPGGYRHYYVLDEKAGDTYRVSDPFWYNTETLDDTHDAIGHVQDYDNEFLGAQLFSYTDTPKKLSSMIEIHLASPAELLITDSQGRRLGRDPVSGTDYDEIPNGQYDQEASIFSGNTEPGDSAHVEKVLRILTPEDDHYSLEVIGTDTGDYTLSTLTINDNGDTETSDIFDSTSEGERDVYIVEVDDEGVLSDVLDALYGYVPLVPDGFQAKFENMLRVLEDKLVKDNVVAVEHHVTTIIRYIETHGLVVPDYANFVALLEALLE